MEITKKIKGIVTDGWSNIFTNLGVAGKDKRTGARVAPKFLTQIEVENFYQADDIAAKVIDCLPEEMTREGFEITTNDPDDYNKVVADWFKDLDLNVKIEWCLKMARLYGGSALLLGIQDGLLPDQPVDLTKIKEIEYATPLSRYDFMPVSIAGLDRDVTSDNYNKPLFYELKTELKDKQEIQGWNGKIHYSRLIRFEGSPVIGVNRAMTQYWGDSVLSRLWNVISNFQMAHDSAATVMQDVVKLIVKLKNLSEMLAQGDDDLVTKRLQLLSSTASVINAIVIQDDESAESRTTSLAGIPEVLKTINDRLVAATDMPHTKLLGESPSGLGATGNSEKMDWYDQVKAKQESILLPVIEALLKLFFLSDESPTKKLIPEGMVINFKALWLPTDKEKAEIRQIVANTDNLYYGMGVLSEDEIAKSRWGTGQFSMETIPDWEARGVLAASSAEEPVEPEEVKIGDE